MRREFHFMKLSGEESNPEEFAFGDMSKGPFLREP